MPSIPPRPAPVSRLAARGAPDAAVSRDAAPPRDASIATRRTSSVGPEIPGFLGAADRALDALGVRMPSTGVVRTSVPVDAPWLGGVENATEVSAVPAQLLEGKIPTGLRGTLLRNGPGRFERGGERVPHWFDGDGGILRVALDGRSAQATVDYKFVRSQALEHDEMAGRFTHPAFGYLPAGTPAARSLLRVKNPANTHVVAMGDRLLALYEGALPTALDARSLETIGEVDLGGLEKSEVFTAHPHTDADGRTFAFAFKQGPGGGASVVELDAAGRILHKNKLPGLRNPPHDFVSAGPFLVFVDSPSKVDALPSLVGIRAMGEQISWNARGRTLFHVVDKETLDLVVTGSAPAFSSAHFGGGRLDDDGNISFIAFIPDEDDPGAKAMGRFMHGERVGVGGRPTLVAIDPKTGDVVKKQRLSDVQAEWPVEDPRDAGQGTSIWCATRSADEGYFDGYARLDRTTGIVDRVELPSGTWGNEPVLSVDADDPNKRWLTTVQYVSSRDRSELVIYDADALAGGPVARLELPTVVPFGFHGSFVPAP